MCSRGFCGRRERATDNNFGTPANFQKKLISFLFHKNTNRHFTDATSVYSAVPRDCWINRFD